VKRLIASVLWLCLSCTPAQRRTTGYVLLAGGGVGASVSVIGLASATPSSCSPFDCSGMTTTYQSYNRKPWFIALGVSAAVALAGAVVLILDYSRK
jgi:hypothetical protein